MSWLTEKLPFLRDMRRGAERGIKDWKKEENIHEKLLQEVYDKMEGLKIRIRALLQTDGAMSPATAKRVADAITKEIVKFAERILK